MVATSNHTLLQTLIAFTNGLSSHAKLTSQLTTLKVTVLNPTLVHHFGTSTMTELNLGNLAKMPFDGDKIKVAGVD